MPESKEHFQDLERHPGWSVLDKTSGNTSVNQTLGKFASFKLKLKQKLKHGYSHPLLYWWTHQSGAEVRTTRSVPNTQVLTCILDETKCRCFYSLSPPVYIAASMATWININFDRSVSAHPQGRVSVGELSGPAFRIYVQILNSLYSVYSLFWNTLKGQNLSAASWRWRCTGPFVVLSFLLLTVLQFPHITLEHFLNCQAAVWMLTMRNPTGTTWCSWMQLKALTVT